MTDPENSDSPPDRSGSPSSSGPRSSSRSNREIDGGDALVTAAVALTAAFVPAAALTAWDPDGWGLVGVVVSLVLFGLGCVANLWALVIAAGRSRHHEISVALLWLLPGSVAPARVRWRLHLATAVQLVVGLAVAAVQPFTGAAFCVLASVFGIGCTGLWGARFGTFDLHERQPSLDGESSEG